MIFTRPHRWNPQLHLYLALLILHGASAADARSDDASAYAFAAHVPQAARRAAQQHLTNAVQLAARYKSVHEHTLRLRLRNADLRAARVRTNLRQYRRVVAARVRAHAPLLASDDERDGEAAEHGEQGVSEGEGEGGGGGGGGGGEAAPSSSSSRSSSDDSDTDIEAALENGFGSDADESPDEALPVHGPEPAPDAADEAPASPREASPSPEHGGAPAADAPTFLFPANDWAASVARLYLDAIK